MIVGGGLKCQGRIVLQSVSFLSGGAPLADILENLCDTIDTQAGRGEISAGNSAREEEIRRRAYEIYLEGGEQPWRELDDWLLAEHELEHRLVLRAKAG